MGGSNSIDKAKPVLETQFTHVDENPVLNRAKKIQLERKNRQNNNVKNFKSCHSQTDSPVGCYLNLLGEFGPNLESMNCSPPLFYIRTIF